MEQTHRIDWFDGTECDPSPAPAPDPATGGDVTPEESPRFEMKLMGFRRLAELAESEPSAILLTLSGRTSFWRLIDSELKPDFIVLIAKVLCSASEGSPALARSLLQRAFSSRYLSVLLHYLSSLPDVRISEKRHNMVLWRDAEDALCVVLRLCAAACRLLAPALAADVTQRLLSAAQAARVGLQQHHAETFSSTLLQLEEQAATQIALMLSKQENTNERTMHGSTHSGDSPGRDYRTMSVLPTEEDLLEGAGCGRYGECEGAGYEGAERYLCEQFHRLREDYIAPLRRDICLHRQDPSSKSEHIRLLGEGVVVSGRRVCAGAGHVLRLTRSGAAQLTHGSLLLLTADNFRTFLAATVLQTIDQHHVCVSLHGVEAGGEEGWRRWGEVLRQRYAVWESCVYAEPYRRVLRALQLTDPLSLPFTQHLVHLQRDVAPPDYLREVESEVEAEAGAEGLDDTQLAAYRHALTHSLALIQGPPGTGKTHTGLQIARALLAHASAGVEAGPLLVVCYTNRALDHFLERLLPYTTEVVRLGGQSESELLRAYTMSERRARRGVRSAAYGAALRRQEGAVTRIDELMATLRAHRTSLLPLSLLEPHLVLRGRSHTLRGAGGDASPHPVHTWLFQHLRREERESDKSETEARVVAESWEEVDGEDTAGEDAQSTDVERTLSPEELACLQMYMEGEEAVISARPDRDVASLYELSVAERWALYVRAARAAQQQCLRDIAQLVTEVKECGQQLKELAQSTEVETARSARVLGATTTGAARHRPLLLALRPPVLLVEEAAEVLEAHILAALTPHCRHLILIGDHLQLRPHTAERRSAHNALAVSLPERLLRAGLPSVCLKTQRRMRPELLALISPLIYPDLVTHPVALRLPSVRGLHKDLFFLTHQCDEERHSVGVGADAEGLSVRNTREAEWACALAAHLRRQDYPATQLVLLSPYAAQARLIHQLSSDYPLLEGVRITTVDNFQGEESRIVILSLVRCNKNGDIGFLAEQNRVCVALSRAKEGLYMLGDMSTLCVRSSLWRNVRRTLTERAAIDDYITLQCHNHPHRLTQVRSAAEVTRASRHGGCDEACDAVLACGHTCRALCHAYDAAHTFFTCAQPCERRCRRGHACPLRCGEACGACSARTELTLPCGHTAHAPCFLDHATLPCAVCSS